MAPTVSTTNSDTADLIKDIKLWVRINIPRFIRVSECEVASAILSAANTEEDGFLSAKDILGVQYMSGSQPFWIINLRSIQAKARVLAAGSVELKEKSLPISDFSAAQSKYPKKANNIRLSIHGIPQNVPDAEVESWVGVFATLASPIFRHKSKEKGDNNEFAHLLTGHRYCFVSKILEEQPRYSKMAIPDPLDPKSLTDVEVVLYYNGQTKANCRYCHGTGHTISSCPVKPKPKCYHCGVVGHVKQRCPDLAKGPKCFKCSNYGHKSFECSGAVDQDQDLQTPKATRPAGKGDKVAEASALAQELIDHCLQHDSAKSPELLNKVKALLNFDVVSEENEDFPSLSEPKEKTKPTCNKKGGKKKSKVPVNKKNPPPNTAAGTSTKTRQSSMKDYGRPTASQTLASNKRKNLSPAADSKQPDKRDRRERLSQEDKEVPSSSKIQESACTEPGNSSVQ